MSAANGGVDRGNSVEVYPTRRSLCDGLEGVSEFGGVLSGSSVEPDNTNGSKSNHQHKEVSGVRLKCAT